MKKSIYLVLTIIFLFACSVKEKPTFIKVDDIQVLSFANDTIKFTANAYFKNENSVGGKIATDELNVFVNDVDVAKVSSDEFKVPAKKEFAVPLLVKVPSKKVFKNGFLGGLLNSVLGNKSVKVRFVGDIKYKVLGFSSIYTVDKTKDLKIKL